ncbi:hypothetical protein SFRURICE_020684 [Spodoptera frugiperda]|uniref:SFRICE_025778 n=1 Tax=Spodoptera frugiperda TaxID=7108 RepID=A0A2H1WVU2_SPOFR|nr:hypothetical protein SFRURICE_020684 [Spodoptera frugiperda]
MIKKFLDANDPEKFNYTFSLKNGCIFFAFFGALLWCTDMLFDKRYKLIMMVNEARYKILYTTVFCIYATCTLTFIIHLSVI